MYMKKIREHWGLAHNYQVWLVFLTFALTGTSIMLLKPHFVAFTGIPKWLYYIIILPVYQIVLLMYGALFGLGSFFWEKEKRFYQKIAQLVRTKNGN